MFCAVPRAGVEDFLDKYGSFGKVPAGEHPKATRKVCVCVCLSVSLSLCLSVCLSVGQIDDNKLL